jgi:phosphoglycolate phosphatase
VTNPADALQLGELYSKPIQVFDLDGTLVDTLVDLTVSLNMALYEHRLAPVSRDLVRASLHGGFEASVHAALLASHAPVELFDTLLESYRRCYRSTSGKRSRIYPGVSRVLRALRGRGARLAICSNKVEGEARALLTILGLAGYFEAVVGADTCGERKPSPVPLSRAVTLLGGTADESLFTGDSEIDIACARAAAIDCAFFSGGYGDCGDAEVVQFDDWRRVAV